MPTATWVSVIASLALSCTALAGCAVPVGAPATASATQTAVDRPTPASASRSSTEQEGLGRRNGHATPEAAKRPSAKRPSARRSTGRPAPPDVRGTRPSDSALGALAALTVRGRAPMTGYSREAFGPAWLDANRNGCDERNDILARDLTGVSEQNCRILRGTLRDPYTAQRVDYVDGDGTLVDIDHVVALGNAWVSGAWAWDIRRRAGLATDPLNLLAVDASTNRRKGDGDAATWLPPDKRYRCSYVARQVAVKAKFRLSVTAPERDAIARVLATCPHRRLPPDSGSAPEVTHRVSEPRAQAAAEADGTRGGRAVWYENCDAVRAAGAAPVRRGDPGYDAHLDRDGDGSGCE